jgi:hypothetical protein
MFLFLEGVAGHTSTFGSARGRSSRRLGFFLVLVFRGSTGLAGFIFPRLWLSSIYPEVFWFHPAEFGQKGFFFAGCYLLWWFLDLSFERHSEAN